jgi:hypothetical protein
METTSNLAQRVAGELRAEMARQGKTMSELCGVLQLSNKTARTRYMGQTELGLNEIEAVSVWLGIDRRQLLIGSSTERVAS